jgi:GTP-binding protein YchF
MKLGIAGYPQVGKKTLFSLLTGQTISEQRSNRQGLAPVGDPRFDRLVDLYHPQKETPAVVEFELLPDLDEDATRNAQALRALENVDAICHVVRAFNDEAVYHISGSVDAARDAQRFAEELQFNDLVFIDKRLERIAREQKSKKDERAQQEQALLERMKEHLESTTSLAEFSFTADDEKLLSSYPLLTRKAVINIINVEESDLQNDALVASIQESLNDPSHACIAVSAQIEDELAQLDSDERKAFLEDLGLEQTALERLTQLCYATLGLISFFTVGEDEVRAWTIRAQSLAPQAGRAIHSDIERGFIRAEIMAYADLIELGSEEKVKAAGKFMQKGRDYVVEDGDIIHFLFKV